MDETTNRRYAIILGRNILTPLGMYLKFSDNIIIGGKLSYEGCSAPIVDVSSYNFTPIKNKTVKWNNPL